MTFSARSPQALSLAPNYSKHRDNVVAVDSVFNKKEMGVNCQEADVAHVQVVPDTGTPHVEIMWWSDAASAFVHEVPVRTANGPGAGTPFEFDVPVGGRIMLVAITTLDAGKVSVFASGHKQIR